jgi:hypothetical protein
MVRAELRFSPVAASPPSPLVPATTFPQSIQKGSRVSGAIDAAAGVMWSRRSTAGKLLGACEGVGVGRVVGSAVGSLLGARDGAKEGLYVAGTVVG